jgi:hypothetical protein
VKGPRDVPALSPWGLLGVVLALLACAVEPTRSLSRAAQ